MAAPVLLNQVLEALRLSPSKFIIDGTLGAGGHARSIIERLAKMKQFSTNRRLQLDLALWNI